MHNDLNIFGQWQACQGYMMQYACRVVSGCTGDWNKIAKNNKRNKQDSYLHNPYANSSSIG